MGCEGGAEGCSARDEVGSATSEARFCAGFLAIPAPIDSRTGSWPESWPRGRDRCSRDAQISGPESRAENPGFQAEISGPRGPDFDPDFRGFRARFSGRFPDFGILAKIARFWGFSDLLKIRVLANPSCFEPNLGFHRQIRVFHLF